MLALFMLSAISTAVFQPVPTEYKLVWNDEFEVDGVADSRYWAYEEGFVRNEELQWYQAENAFCQQGKLIIEARRENRDNPNFQAGKAQWLPLGFAAVPLRYRDTSAQLERIVVDACIKLL